MRIVVVGGAGYIGSVVSRRLLAAGHDLVVADNLATGHREAVPPGVPLVEVDVRDRATLAEKVLPGADAVMHFAARSLVGESEQRPELYWDNNVGGTRSLLDAMRDAGVRCLVFSSTASTYGEPQSIPVDEEQRVKPTSAYGSSKLAADMMIGDEARAHGLRAVSLRYFNVAGALEDAGERHHPETHLIPNVLRVAAGKAPFLTVFGDDYPTADGTCIRDYLHVNDLASAHLLALDSMGPGAIDGRGRHRIYNLGNGAGFSVLEIVAAARRVTGAVIPVQVVRRRPGDPAVLVASSRRIQDELGWIPKHPGLEEIIGDAWTFTRSRPLAEDITG